MFTKLLTHEWKATRGLVGLLCAIIGISGLLAGGILRYMIWSSATGNEFMVVAYTIVLTAAVLAILGGCIAATYLLVHHFYKSRFTDQGYLMLTLPVTTHQQLLSSILNTAIGVFLVGITAVFSAAAGIGIFLNSFDSDTVNELIRAFTVSGNAVSDLLNLSGGLMLLNLLQLAVALLADIVLLMLAITVGSQAARHPVLKGAALYIGLDILVSESCTLFGSLAEKTMTRPQLWTVLFSCALYAVTALLAYFTMYRIFEKKLNLT